MLTFSDSTVLGSWGLGGTVDSVSGPVGYGEVSDIAAQQLLTAAWKLGVRWIDLAPGYGNGAAAERLGDWQSKTGNRFNIALKVGRPVEHGKSCPNYEISALLEEIYVTSAIVGLPSIVIIKDPPPRILSSYHEISAQLRQSKADVTFGFSGHNPSTFSLACKVQEPSIAEVEFNGTNWIFAWKAIQCLRARGWTVWGMQPLAYGFLTGKYDRMEPFPPTDWRSTILVPDREILIKLSRAFHQRFMILNVSPAVRALAFCFAQPMIRRVVVGPKSAMQLEGVKEAWDLAARPEVSELVARFTRSLSHCDEEH